MKFSNSFGWGADVTAVFSDSIALEIVSIPDFTSEKTSDFETIPAFYAVNTYLSANFKPVSALENGSYYLCLKVNTNNPTFTIRKIIVVSG